MIQKFKQWLHREVSTAIADLSRDLDAVKAELEAAKATAGAQQKQLEVLVRDDAQIDALRRIVTATEYVMKAAKHDRQAHAQRADFA